MFRQDSTAQQTMKRTWTKTITNETFSKPVMPETKKHKASSNVAEKAPVLVQESMIIQLPATETQIGENHKANDEEETNSTTPPIDEEVTQILNSSDKENNLHNENESLRKQVNYMFK